MAYDRDAAVQYAKDHWDTVCSDRYISVLEAPAINVDQKFKELRLPEPKAAWQVKFVPDPDGGDMAVWMNPTTGISRVIQRWEGLADCAHFMTKCLTAGGIQNLKTDYVPYLNNFLRNLRPATKVLGSEISESRAKQIIDKKLLKKGDVILYVAAPGGELGGGYVHSAMFTDDSGNITCHSINRFGDSWTAPHSTGYTFTLIHFVEGDAANALLDGRISGWWTVSWRGDTYYYFFGHGDATYTQQKPTSKVAPAFPKQRGVYFFNPARPDQVRVCWPQTGSLEEFTVGADGQSMTGRWNGAEDITATKMPL